MLLTAFTYTNRFLFLMRFSSTNRSEHETKKSSQRRQRRPLRSWKAQRAYLLLSGTFWAEEKAAGLLSNRWLLKPGPDSSWQVRSAWLKNDSTGPSSHASLKISFSITALYFRFSPATSNISTNQNVKKANSFNSTAESLLTTCVT